MQRLDYTWFSRHIILTDYMLSRTNPLANWFLPGKLALRISLSLVWERLCWASKAIFKLDKYVLVFSLSFVESSQPKCLILFNDVSEYRVIILLPPSVRIVYTYIIYLTVWVKCFFSNYYRSIIWLLAAAISDMTFFIYYRYLRINMIFFLWPPYINRCT